MPTNSANVWRDDGMIVATRGATFPRRCIRCNESSVNTSVWLSMAWSPNVKTGNKYASQAARFVTAEHVRVRIYLCGKHRRKNRGLRGLGIVLCLCGIGMVVLSAFGAANPSSSAAMLIILSAVGIAAGIAGVTLGRYCKTFGLSVESADAHVSRIAGGGKEFVASLQDLSAFQFAESMRIQQKLERLEVDPSDGSDTSPSLATFADNSEIGLTSAAQAGDSTALEGLGAAARASRANRKPPKGTRPYLLMAVASIPLAGMGLFGSIALLARGEFSFVYVAMALIGAVMTLTAFSKY